MKKLNLLTAIAGMILSTLGLSSCLNDDGYSLDYYSISYATATPLNDKACYFTLDNGATLWPAAPVNMHFHPAKRQRVQLNYTVLGDNFQGYDYAIRVNRVDTILTKLPVEDKGADNDSIYGNDPVEIIEIWVGDGFLNIIFKMPYSGHFKHAVNLLRDTADASIPYKLEFRHNSFEDKSPYMVYGLVAFDLSEIDTKGEEVDLVIKVNTIDGMKEYKKKYIPGRYTELQPELKPGLKIDKNSLNHLE